MNENHTQKRLDEIKEQIITLGQELENIVSIESIALRLILKNILEIANSFEAPTFHEKVELSYKNLIETMRVTLNGNTKFFPILQKLADENYAGLKAVSWKIPHSSMISNVITIDFAFDEIEYENMDSSKQMNPKAQTRLLDQKIREFIKKS